MQYWKILKDSLLTDQDSRRVTEAGFWRVSCDRRGLGGEAKRKDVRVRLRRASANPEGASRGSHDGPRSVLRLTEHHHDGSLRQCLAGPLDGILFLDNASAEGYDTMGLQS